jgi:putative hydrolase of the HAD superfamily
MQSLSAPTTQKSNPSQDASGEFKAVLFDLFDTLVLIGDDHDCYMRALNRLHSTLHRHGFKCSFPVFESAYVKVVKQITAQTAVSLKEPPFKTYIEETLAKLGFKTSTKKDAVAEAIRVFCNEFNRHITLDPQTKDLLQYLQPKYKLGVVSNLTFAEAAWSILNSYRIKKFFDFVVISGDVSLRKPHPKLFKLALDSLGVEASEAIFVGDTLETDIQGALNVGMLPILIDRKSRKAIDSFDKPYLTIYALEELVPILAEFESPITC